MDPESSSQRAIVSDDNDVRNERIKKGKFLVLLIFFVGTSIGHIITIALGVPMLRHCHNVALIVMILGTVLGILQQIPEFFRNFVQIKPENEAYVNYSLGTIVIIRVAWLITATVTIVTSKCDNITPAWVCISINWAIFGFIVIIIAVVTVVKFVKKRSRRYDD
ncbi:hypothetical protein HA402_009872 [Bradysia odoriphaga]|nr:hypothetical protein HA402_009872 [Bradysia odoriphaga]